MSKSEIGRDLPPAASLYQTDQVETSRTSTRWVPTLITCLALALALGLSAATPAAAAPLATYQVTDDVSARSTPTAAPTGVYGIPRGASFGVNCQVIGQPIGPYGNTLYFLSDYAGRQFYIPDTYTTSPHLAGQPPIPGIPMCGSTGIQGSPICVQNCSQTTPLRATPGQLAVNWARTQIGSRYASAADAAHFARSDWAPGPYAEWAGDCAKFPALALGHATGQYNKVVSGNAYPQYLYYARRGMVRSGPPNVPGAVVFYRTAMPYGHTALATGNGTVVTTRGMDGAGAPIEERPYNYFPNYLGYVVLL